MFDPQVHPLGHDIAPDSFIDNYTDSMLSNIEDSTSFAVVNFVGHTFLNGTITFDVDDITSFVDVHVFGKPDGTGLSEGLGKHVPSTSSFTVSVSHFGLVLLGFLE